MGWGRNGLWGGVEIITASVYAVDFFFVVWGIIALPGGQTPKYDRSRNDETYVTSTPGHYVNDSAFV